MLVNSVLPAEAGVLKVDQINAGTTEDLTGVSGNGTEVWVTGAHGTIRHFNGTSWAAQAVIASAGCSSLETHAHEDSFSW